MIAIIYIFSLFLVIIETFYITVMPPGRIGIQAKSPLISEFLLEMEHHHLHTPAHLNNYDYSFHDARSNKANSGNNKTKANSGNNKKNINKRKKISYTASDRDSVSAGSHAMLTRTNNELVFRIIRNILIVSIIHRKLLCFSSVYIFLK